MVIARWNKKKRLLRQYSIDTILVLQDKNALLVMGCNANVFNAPEIYA